MAGTLLPTMMVLREASEGFGMAISRAADDAFETARHAAENLVRDLKEVPPAQVAGGQAQSIFPDHAPEAVERYSSIATRMCLTRLSSSRGFRTTCLTPAASARAAMFLSG